MNNLCRSCAWLLRQPDRRLVVARINAYSEASFFAKIQWRACFRSPPTGFKIRETEFSCPSSSLSTRHSFSSFSSPSSSLSKTRTGFIGWYLRKLDTHPFITKSITSSLIYAAADLTSQGSADATVVLGLTSAAVHDVIHLAMILGWKFRIWNLMITMPSPHSFDLIRTTRMATYGLLILGPSQHLWFDFMSRILPKRDVLTTFKKIFLGQALYGPIITTVFFSYNASFQGESGSEIAARLKRDLLPTLANGLLFWPVCDFFTYKFVPVHLQPLMNSSCAYIWTIYLTYMASLKGVDIN